MFGKVERVLSSKLAKNCQICKKSSLLFEAILILFFHISEHSNQLWNVSGVQHWNKVYLGLIKMYRAEVISKFPIIQHTYFGSMFTLEPAKNQRGVAKLIDNQRPPPRPKFNPNAPSRMPPPSLSNK